MTDLDLLTIDQVSEELSIPVATLYFWRHQGAGPPAIKIGRALRYPRSALAEWVRNQPGAECLEKTESSTKPLRPGRRR